MQSVAARAALSGSAPTMRREFARESGDALHALALRAELLVEDDLIELRQTVFELRLQIGLVEEFRVRQTRGDDALIAGDHRRAAVARLDVRDEDEAVGQPVSLAQHETFLIHADRGANDFRRNGEEAFVERPHQRHRPFDEAGDLFQQAHVLDEFEPLREGEILGVMQDDVASARGIEDDLGALQRHGVILEAPHAKFAPAPGSDGRA